ncbi:MAG: hypothetical protein HYS20_02200 [Rhodocyclales bacterium]|nr:hypothetical protein [Rhodocyclales bacterium]
MNGFSLKKLSISIVVSVLGMAPSLALSNDNFSDAITLLGTRGQITGANTGTTKEIGEPDHAGTIGGKSLWWNWMAPVDGELVIDTAGSTFDTVLAAYSGASVDSLNLLAFSDDADGGQFARISFPVSSGVTYRVALDGYDGADGNVDLHWSMGLPSADVTATAGSGGTVSPGLLTVDIGSTASFVVAPNSGYAVGNVGGTCPTGAFVDNTYTTGGIVSNCAVSFSFDLVPPAHTVSASAGDGGSVAPASQRVVFGTKATFIVVPESGYMHGAVTGTCSVGSFVDNAYTTGEITSDCGVAFSFSRQPYTVSANAGSGGNVSPANQAVSSGTKAVFNVTPHIGYEHGTAGGTCPAGSFVDNTYTTGEIVSDCNISFSFSAQSYTVSSSASAGGSVTPATQVIGSGGAATFVATPEVNFKHGPVGGTCPSGRYSGNNYTTGSIVADCTIDFSFIETGKKPFRRGSWRALLPFQ